MEYGLWRNQNEGIADSFDRLNPCSNGIWSLTKGERLWQQPLPCLNPCSNGIWSLTDH